MKSVLNYIFALLLVGCGTRDSQMIDVTGMVSMDKPYRIHTSLIAKQIEAARNSDSPPSTMQKVGTGIVGSVVLVVLTIVSCGQIWNNGSYGPEINLQIVDEKSEVVLNQRLLDGDNTIATSLPIGDYNIFSSTRMEKFYLGKLHVNSANKTFTLRLFGPDLRMGK